MRVPKQWALLSDAKIRLKAGVICKPLWFDVAATLAPKMPPILTRKQRPKLKEIVFPEDRLRNIYLQRNPEGHLYPLRFFPHESTAEYMITSPADVFVSKQIEFIQEKGHTENQAYIATQKWFNEKLYASDLETDLLEAQIALFEPQLGIEKEATPFYRIHRQYFNPEYDSHIDDFPRLLTEEQENNIWEQWENEAGKATGLYPLLEMAAAPPPPPMEAEDEQPFEEFEIEETDKVIGFVFNGFPKKKPQSTLSAAQKLLKKMMKEERDGTATQGGWKANGEEWLFPPQLLNKTFTPDEEEPADEFEVNARVEDVLTTPEYLVTMWQKNEARKKKGDGSDEFVTKKRK